MANRPVSLEQNRRVIRPTEVDIRVTIKVIANSKMLTTGFTVPPGDDGEVIHVAFLSYMEEGENNGNARLDSISYVTLEELIAHESTKKRKKHEMGKHAYKHFKWVSTCSQSRIFLLTHPLALSVYKRVKG